jgi:hypothetical protein
MKVCIGAAGSVEGRDGIIVEIRASAVALDDDTVTE